ncbi:hypothetical protein ACERIM_11960 [Natrinema sp. H-ect1]|uniref:hypothetical protein n=1 Tax=Natrinema sp. H-ect1 TaxID=3242700 RepID=UPI00359E95EE
MKYLKESLLFTIGILLMAVVIQSTLSTLIKQASPNTIIVGGGNVDAVFAAFLFCVGCFLAAHALFLGLNSKDN